MPFKPCSSLGLAGYHIRHERRVTKRTKLLFCTAGVLLRTLRGFEEEDEDDFVEEEEADDNEGRSFVKRATHIILDEVHERAADGDLFASCRSAGFQLWDLRVNTQESVPRGPAASHETTVKRRLPRFQSEQSLVNKSMSMPARFAL